MRIFAAFFLLFILIESTEAFVYSCPEVDDRVSTRFIIIHSAIIIIN